MVQDLSMIKMSRMKAVLEHIHYVNKQWNKNIYNWEIDTRDLTKYLKLIVRLSSQNLSKH